MYLRDNNKTIDLLTKHRKENIGLNPVSSRGNSEDSDLYMKKILRRPPKAKATKKKRRRRKKRTTKKIDTIAQKG